MLNERVPSDGTFAHNTFWTMANRHINYAAIHEQGAFYDYLTAMLYALFAFEAYLSFVGKHFSPDPLAAEEDMSRSVPEKTKKVLDACGILVLPEAGKSFRTLAQLQSLKDKLRRGDPVALAGMYQPVAAASNTTVQAGTIINRTTALLALHDVEQCFGAVYDSAGHLLADKRFRSARLAVNANYRAHSIGLV
jgi:hypothetical protein